MVSSAKWCIGKSVGLAKLSQISNGGSSLAVKASQFARTAFSCLYMGLIVVTINIKET